MSSRQYYLAHKEEVLRSCRKWKEAHPDYNREYLSEYRKRPEYAEQRKEYNRRWKERNPNYRKPPRTWLDYLWDSMKSRCLNPNAANYYRYGGRGITIYEPWIESKEEFQTYILEVLGPRPSPEYSLDRINNNEGYYPGNVRWATRSEQQNNKNSYRRSNQYIKAKELEYEQTKYREAIG